MKTFLLILLAALLLAFSAHAATGDIRSGVWTAELRDDRLQLNIFRGGDERHRGTNMMGFSLPLAETGLARGDAEAASANVNFAIKHDAGTIAFDGHFATGNGAGHYRFTPNDAFERELNALGYDDIRDDEMLLFTTQNLTVGTVRDLIAAGRKPERRQLDEIAVFRVDAATLREFAALGFPNLTIREAVEMRIGKIDAAFVRDIRALGFAPLSAHQVSELGILGVTPAYIRSLRDAGLRELTPREAQELRIGNVTPKMIEDFHRLGYTNLTARQLSELGIQHVTPQFVEQMRAAGYRDLTPRQLVELKIFNVTPEYINSMKKK